MDVESLDDTLVVVDESFDDLEQSILSILAEDDFLTCKDNSEMINKDNDLDISELEAESSNENMSHQAPLILPNVTIKKNYLNSITDSKSPIKKKFKSNNVLLTDNNIANVKSPIKLKFSILDQKENYSNKEDEFSLCSRNPLNPNKHIPIHKNNQNNFKTNALGDILNKISSSPLKSEHNFNFSSKFIQKNENRILDSKIKSNVKNSCPEEIPLLQKSDDKSLSTSPPFTLHIISELFPNHESSSHAQHTIDNNSTQTRYMDKVSLTHPLLTENKCNNFEKSKENISSELIHESDKVQNKISSSTVIKQNPLTEDEILSLFGSGDLVPVSEELDDSILFDDNDQKILENNNSAIILNKVIDNKITDTKKQCPKQNLTLKPILVNEKKSNLSVTNELLDPKIRESNAKVMSSSEQKLINLNSQLVTNEPIENCASTAKPVVTKQYLLPFKSNDPDENNDIEHPDWDAVRNLTTDEERYNEVKQRWKSKAVPNPNYDLTFHSFRKRRMQKELHVQKNVKQGVKRAAEQNLAQPSAKRIRTMTVACTYFVDNKIQSIKRQCDSEAQKIQREYTCASDSIKQASNYFDFTKSNNYQSRQAAINDLRSTRDAKIQFARSAWNSQLIMLEKSKDEITKFCNFYRGLNILHNGEYDPTILTESQIKAIEEIDNVYDQFSKYYKGC